MPRCPIRKCVTTGPKSGAEVGSCSRGTCNEPRFRISNRWVVIDRCLGRWASQITINLRMGCKTKKRLGVIEILPAIGLGSRVRNGYRLTIRSNPNVSVLNIFLRKETFVQVELRGVLWLMVRSGTDWLFARKSFQDRIHSFRMDSYGMDVGNLCLLLYLNWHRKVIVLVGILFCLKMSAIRVTVDGTVCSKMRYYVKILSIWRV